MLRPCTCVKKLLSEWIQICSYPFGCLVIIV
uniref:Uncharacterized protein n=1 Tax=Anguilla anguilla TaxID=7936 RepID=A0A0E9S4V1_ANGAN